MDEGGWTTERDDAVFFTPVLIMRAILDYEGNSLRIRGDR